MGLDHKKMTIGSFIMLLGVASGILWRLQSARNATYDNFDPGYFLLLPGIIIYFIGLNQQSVVSKGWRVLGNFLVFIGGFTLFGLGKSIGIAVYATHKFDITGFIVYGLIILLFPFGTAILLKKKK